MSEAVNQLPDYMVNTLNLVPWPYIQKRRRCRALCAVLNTTQAEIAKKVGMSTSLVYRLVVGKQKETIYQPEHMQKLKDFGIPDAVFAEETTEPWDDAMLDWTSIPQYAKGAIWFALHDTDADEIAKQVGMSRILIDQILSGKHQKRSTPYYARRLVSIGFPKDIFTPDIVSKMSTLPA